LQALLVCVAPLCVLQALLARPVIELLFHDRWLPAVPVVQWISLALATQPVALVANAALMARGRFGALAGVAAVSAAATTLGAAAGALIGDQVQIAQGVAAGLVIGNGWAGWRASREFASYGRTMAAAVLPPVCCSLVVFLVGYTVASVSGSHSLVAELLCVVTLGFGAQLLILKVLFPDLLQQLRAGCHPGLPPPLARSPSEAGQPSRS
jgi:PST family polysaccharide transporter